MTKRILAVRESDLGEHELRNTDLIAFHFLDLDLLDKLSKEQVLEKWIPVWTERYKEHPEPVEGTDWSFADLMEEVSCNGIKLSDYYDMDVINIDIDNKNEKDSKSLLSFLKENSQKPDGLTDDIVFQKHYLEPFFDAETIKLLSLKDDIGFVENTSGCITTPKGNINF